MGCPRRPTGAYLALRRRPGRAANAAQSDLVTGDGEGSLGHLESGAGDHVDQPVRLPPGERTDRRPRRRGGRRPRGCPPAAGSRRGRQPPHPVEVRREPRAAGPAGRGGGSSTTRPRLSSPGQGRCSTPPYVEGVGYLRSAGLEHDHRGIEPSTGTPRCGKERPAPSQVDPEAGRHHRPGQGFRLASPSRRGVGGCPRQSTLSPSTVVSWL